MSFQQISGLKIGSLKLFLPIFSFIIIASLNVKKFFNDPIDEKNINSSQIVSGQEVRKIQVQPLVEIHNLNQTVPNYADKLPPIDVIIDEFENLDSDEIDNRISRVEEEIREKDLISKANSQSLNEEGFRDLARLMQLSDALYNVKIERQISAIEKDLRQKKSGA